jgi:AcrR family transcriptional regulator
VSPTAAAERPRAGRTGRTGRRVGSSDTRGRILAAARSAFGERGFEATTIRDVAARAEVDPALVHHYFGSKQQLFVSAMQFPSELQAMIPQLIAGPPEEVGERYVRFLLELWETPTVRPLLLGVVRSATTDPVAATMLRQLLTEGPILALAGAIDRPDARLRATLAGSQLIGLALARYVVAVEPLASTAPEVLVRAVGPTIQRYLAGDPTGEGGDPTAWPGDPTGDGGDPTGPDPRPKDPPRA